MSIIESIFVWLNTTRNRISMKRYRPEQVLVLLPHCLQKQGCKELVKEDINNCRMCGQCRMKEMKQLAQRLKIRVHVASGGREALSHARAPGIAVVLAVACSKELAEGIRGTFPRRVVGVLNIWPHGPCKDTDVDMKKVETALESLLIKE